MFKTFKFLIGYNTVDMEQFYDMEKNQSAIEYDKKLSRAWKEIMADERMTKKVVNEEDSEIQEAVWLRVGTPQVCSPPHICR